MGFATGPPTLGPESMQVLIGTPEDWPEDMMTHCDTEGLRDAQECSLIEIEESTHCGAEDAPERSSTQMALQHLFVSMSQVLVATPCLHQMPLATSSSSAVGAQIMNKQISTGQEDSASVDGCL